MQKSKLLTATAVCSVAIAAVITSIPSTSAYRGDLSQNNGFGQNAKNQGPRLTQEQREEINTILENKDYEAWLEVAPEKGPKSDLSEEEFETFAEEHVERKEEREEEREERKAQREAIKEALLAKDYETFQELTEDNKHAADLTEEEFLEKAEKFIEREEHREAVKQAIEDGDYETWKELLTENGHNPQILEVITADNFSELQELHELREAGEFEEAKEKASELGIEAPKRKKGHRGFGGRR